MRENEPVVGVGHHAHLTLNGSNLLLRSGLRTSHTEERHFEVCVREEFVRFGSFGG